MIVWISRSYCLVDRFAWPIPKLQIYSQMNHARKFYNESYHKVKRYSFYQAGRSDSVRRKPGFRAKDPQLIRIEPRLIKLNGKREVDVSSGILRDGAFPSLRIACGGKTFGFIKGEFRWAYQFYRRNVAIPPIGISSPAVCEIKIWLEKAGIHVSGPNRRS